MLAELLALHGKSFPTLYYGSFGATSVGYALARWLLTEGFDGVLCAS